MHSPPPLRCFLLVWLFFGQVAYGYVLADGDGTQNTTPPTDDPGFANIANTSGATGVYLGDGWLLVPQHVLGNNSSTSLSGTSYSLRTEMRVRLHNPGNWNDLNDLVMIPVNNPPAGLPLIPIASSPPSLGTTGGGPRQPAETVTMIGIGRDRQPNKTYWQIGGGTATEVEEDEHNHSGYKTFSSRSKRWGTNTRFDNQFYTALNTRSWATQFNETVANNAQGVTGDSGGGVFVKRDGIWYLAGVSIAVSGVSGQPQNFTGSNAVFNTLTFHADLSHFASQLATIRSLENPYQVWMYHRLKDEWDPVLADPLADLDQDGRINLLEYAFNTNPLVPGQANAPLMLPGEGSNPPRFRYFRFTNRTDLAYVPEWSTDLQSWSDEDLTDTVVATSGSQQTREVTHPNIATDRLFFRLRVELLE